MGPWFVAGTLCVAQDVPRSDQPMLEISRTDQPLNNGEDVFRFAIMGDRTGGMRAGVFERAAEKVNLMQPEFVMSVGDLVDGYTTDPTVWNAQWEEFDAIVDGLDMRFHYVPGNHDISNAQLDSVWRARHGSPWYTFVYKDVLFVALHTEDRKGGGIGEQQITDVLAALERHADVRWTLLFMHRPLWDYGDRAGYERIEQALGDRPYTLFSGHHHHYLYSRRNGRDHYVLATSGGGSDLRGVEFGEFDHITWVTMRQDGPVVAHLELDGILDKDIVTDGNRDLVQALRLGGWLTVDPIVHDGPMFGGAGPGDALRTRMRFSNPEAAPMRVSGRLMPVHGIRFEPEVIDTLVAAGSEVVLDLALAADGGGANVAVRGGADGAVDVAASIHALNEAGVAVTLQASYVVNGRELGLSVTRPLSLDWVGVVPFEKQAVAVDGSLDEWDPEAFVDVSRPVHMHEGWDWNGPQDGRWRWASRMDSEALYVAVEAFDERAIVPSREAFSAHQDQFFIQLDADDPVEHEDADRIPSRLYGHEWVGPEHFLQVKIAPGASSGEPLVERNDTTVQVRAALGEAYGGAEDSKDGTGRVWRVEAAIPLEYVARRQGHEWRSVRLNIGWMDHDRPENTKPSILWWRPVWGKEGDVAGGAVFLRDPMASGGEVEAALYDVDPELVTPGASQEVREVLALLSDLYGEYILSGQQDLTWQDSVDMARRVFDLTGTTPVVMGYDFMNYHRQELDGGSGLRQVEEAIEHWNRGGLATFCWHWRDPSLQTQAFYTRLTDVVIDLENPEVREQLIRDIDLIAGDLKRLQEAGVPVLWRPLHEASGGWFWWGANGPQAYIDLWRLMFQRLTETHGLNNLIWVYNGQDPAWYPGDDVVDMIGEDVYSRPVVDLATGEPMPDLSSQRRRFLEAARTPGRPMIVAMTENGSIPDPDRMAEDGAMWSFFVTWNDRPEFAHPDNFLSGTRWNPEAHRLKVFHHDRVLTLEEFVDIRERWRLGEESGFSRPH